MLGQLNQVSHHRAVGSGAAGAARAAPLFFPS